MEGCSKRMFRLITIRAVLTSVMVIFLIVSSYAQDNPVLLKYKKTLEANPDNRETRYLLGSAQFKTGDYDGAVKNLTKVYEFRKGDAALAFKIGFAYYNLGRFEEASLYYRNSKEIVLENKNLSQEFREELSTAFFNLGVEYQDLADYGRSIENYEESILLSKDDVTTVCMIGLAHYQNSELDKSIKKFKKCIDNAPENIWAADYIVSIYEARGIEHIKRGNNKDATDMFAEVLKLRPKYEKASYYNCFIMYSNGDIYGTKTCIGEMADIKDVEVQQGVGVLLFNIGVILQDYEDWLSSIEALKKANNFIVPSEETYLYISKAYMESGNYNEALSWFKETLNISPDSKDAEIGLAVATERAVISHLRKSKVYLKERKLESALEEVSAALLLEPTSNEALGAKKLVHGAIMETVKKTDRDGAVKQFLLLASDAFKKHKYNKALKNYNMALNLDRDSGEARTGMEETMAVKALKIEEKLRLGKESHNGGRYYRAAKHFQSLLKIEPSHKDARDRLKDSRLALKKITSPMVKTAEKHLKAGNVESAFVEFEKVLDVDPSNVTASNYLSKVDKIKAKKALVNKVNILYLKGIELYTKGEYKEAVTAWEEVLALSPRHEKAILNIQKTRKILK